MNVRRRAALAFAAILVAVASAPAAQAQWHDMDERVELRILDRDAYDELPQYVYRGQTWVPGTPGHRYAVQLTNHSPARVLVVLSVDGINAVTGQTARANQAGYVLEPYATTEVAGWRKSMVDVAQFYFADIRDSYAARTGRPDNVGVIGIAVFDEARLVPRVYLPERRDADTPMAPPMAQSRSQELGTGHGGREYAPAVRRGFLRASARPVQVTEIRYDDADALARRGIGPGRYGRRWGHEPQAFPGGFVPDPPPRW
ncbi:hypothetical protein [Cognatilysobacter lacus]|uniref:Uncharacterized protein n=1 Tax=Cognatilysobacter lacus TaxID=1643323 RepID=A0A5D8YX09_9GAMM|nr:hypothetical protein [Lysobacter lacus]TZF87051.1 hypothetical protein FW784_11660 [Lysobacter lacus]